VNDAVLLEADKLCKRYPSAVALDEVDFGLRAGEVHALMGENGAGKSTLIKVLTGAEARSGGTIRLEGAEIDFADSAAAQRAGVWAVHQEVMVLPNLSVAENLLLGYQPKRFGLIDRKGHAARGREDPYRPSVWDIDVDRPLGSFPVAVRQLVAIARAVRAEARVLVLDEPTASLDAQEVERLFALVRDLAARGTGIVFITHFLDQVYALTDRITVLRNGRSLGTFETPRLPQVELVSLMIGKHLEEAIAHPVEESESERELIARFRGLGRRGMVEPFDLELRAGEAVGAAGLLGSGRSETALLMFGAVRADAGEIEIAGRSVRIDSPAQAARHGLAFSPEDRQSDAVFATLSIRDNICLALQAKRGWLRKLPFAKQQALADEYIAAIRIKTSDAEKAIGELSGGNQQKVLLARWLATEPRVLILDEPTRGIDVGAHAEIIRLIEELRNDGMALYVISSEFEELVVYSDRISIMRDRRQVGLLSGRPLSVGRIVAEIAGATSR